MAKEQVLGFKPAPRLEQIDDEYFEQCKTASIALNHAMIPASRRESQAEWNFSGRTGDHGTTAAATTRASMKRLPDLLVAIPTSRQSCCNSGKARISTPGPK
jgi:hypothetical protein